jgi:hypothetical protein
MNTEKNIAPHAETLRFWGEKMLDDLHHHSPFRLGRATEATDFSPWRKWPIRTSVASHFLTSMA